MKKAEDLSLPEDRAITEQEAAVVDWVLAHGAFEGNLDHLRGGVHELRVVARCGCGCASVDFVDGGQAGSARPVAEAIGSDSRGRECGVLVWALEGHVSGLEIYEREGDSSSEVPAVESLLRWEDTSSRAAEGPSARGGPATAIGAIPLLACPYCSMEIRLRELDHPGLLKNYRVCPNCHGKFTPDAKTKQRQAILIVASIIPLGLTLLLYFHGTEWLLPAVFSYVAFGWSIHRGNRHVFLVPHQPDRDAANDT